MAAKKSSTTNSPKPAKSRQAGIVPAQLHWAPSSKPGLSSFHTCSSPAVPPGTTNSARPMADSARAGMTIAEPIPAQPQNSSSIGTPGGAGQVVLCWELVSGRTSWMRLRDRRSRYPGSTRRLVRQTAPQVAESSGRRPWANPCGRQVQDHRGHRDGIAFAARQQRRVFG